ncbi:hypothetical protein BTR14_07130 [Rhizobium rhizosphaerae]|uniref:Uncharacterized protein n=2 Tax=Xaviernesmea rhizosphaerae TaxID=1672749 RepID=A0ABX3PGG6_9HYPH|nr:hypothetical protein BTR14_07130 [Xaviernesmea rhizosphaerae]
MRDDAGAIHLTGTIDKGDDQRFLALAEPGVALIVDTPGGDLRGGLDLAHAVRDKATHLIVEGKCWSACANYLFPAAAKRTVMPEGTVCYHGGFVRTFKAYVDSMGGETNLKARLRQTLDKALEVGGSPDDRDVVSLFRKGMNEDGGPDVLVDKLYVTLFVDRFREEFEADYRDTTELYETANVKLSLLTDSEEIAISPVLEALLNGQKVHRKQALWCPAKADLVAAGYGDLEMQDLSEPALFELGHRYGKQTVLSLFSGNEGQEGWRRVKTKTTSRVTKLTFVIGPLPDTQDEPASH